MTARGAVGRTVKSARMDYLDRVAAHQIHLILWNTNHIRVSQMTAINLDAVPHL